ncbi:hypothetical protein PVL29_009654 [Vitis rotundifolia]|uniref:Uncharacterized protein n=1 Tax=Vitis rotundifolia TaxID=103349 RepID=A0AA38ZSZ2_VITRO|nr:hypothetical protein PVL29_009654 [Vitis rotundifolia]
MRKNGIWRGADTNSNSEKGLSKGDANDLLSLLQDQANAIAREVRVMVFNLVKAAQESLSEIVLVGQSHAAIPCSNTDNSIQLFLQDVSICNKGCSSKGPMLKPNSTHRFWRRQPRQEECQQLETYSFSTSLNAAAIEESIHEKVLVDDSMNSEFYDSGMKHIVLENASGL